MIDRAGPYADHVFVLDGSLLIFGTRSPGDLEAFSRMIVDHFTRFHQCSDAQNRRDVMIGRTPAVAFTQTCHGEVFARLALVNHDFGLVTFTTTTAGQESDALDWLLERLGGLEWRSGS